MNKIARKLVLSVLTVVLTVGALGTTTFAWFTLTNTAVIQSFDAEIVAETGIEIALDDGADPTLFNWVSTLATADINAFIGGSFLFDDVTTENGIDFFNYGNDDLIGTTSGYLELPIHFRSSTASSINWEQVSLTSVPEAWTTGVDFTSQEAGGTVRTAGSQFIVNAADSMRIAVIGSTEITPVTTPRTFSTEVVAFENPASATNVVLGIGGDLSYLATPLDGLGAAGAPNYYYAVNNRLVPGSNAVVTVPTITALANNRVLDMDAGSGLAAGLVDHEFYGTITIRIWLEGWDVNTYNAVLSRIITTRFVFTGV